MPKSPHQQAFSLVEITLALGIAAVALVSVIGLLGVGTGANANSDRETNLVAMSQHVLAQLRVADFDSLWAAEPEANDIPTPKGDPGAPQDSVFYFDQEGARLEVGEEESFKATYECRVKKTPDTGTRISNNGPYNLMKLELFFSAPISANKDPEKRPTRHTIHASIARY